MAGACQQNSGIFLVRGGGLRAARDRTRYRRGPRLGPGQDAGGGRGRDWDKMPVTKSHGQVADSERPETGQDAGGGRGRDWDEIPAGAEAEQAGSKSTQKKALYNILQQFWIFQILLSCNNQIAVL